MNNKVIYYCIFVLLTMLPMTNLPYFQELLREAASEGAFYILIFVIPIILILRSKDNLYNL